MGAPGTTWLYKKLLRPVLFEQNPEEIHERLIHTLGWVSRQELLQLQAVVRKIPVSDHVIK